MLAGLLLEFDVIVSSALLSLGALSFQRLIDALVKCENRQVRAIQEVTIHANLVENTLLQALSQGEKGGDCVSTHGHGRSF
ncbi:hypothetical protein J1N35_042808 [Gossypium stocksii]|uniref:Uncharacterized protein n=1 Tax=Gossypium stocksii TaxID=47602 RepID=A0A9D3ZEE7_9ROSI|nr:hypothetical protein J1N35_042808 [Gossypium stocksii]